MTAGEDRADRRRSRRGAAAPAGRAPDVTTDPPADAARAAMTAPPRALPDTVPHPPPHAGPGPLRVIPVGYRPALALALVSAVGLVGFGWPLLAAPDSALAHSRDAPWLFAALLPLTLAVALAEIGAGRMDSKAVALLGVLAAIGAALRPLGTGVAGFEPMFFLFVLAGRVMGRGFGFLLGTIALFASALLTAGVGPWLPYQMLGAAWMGFGAGCLPAVRGRAEIGLLAAYGAVASVAYGWLQNLASWPFLTSVASAIAYVPGDPLATNLGRFAAFNFATALGFDLPRAVTTAVLVAVTGRPVLLALRRAARRAAFTAPGRFTPQPDREG
jgi:energy-coupling factor transport system substrate-specific component